MKRTAVLFVTVSAISLQHAFAALLIQETFNYPTGSIIGKTANGTGLNAGTAWSKAAASGTSFTVQGSSLTFTGHFASAGGSLLISNPSGPYAEDSASAAVNATLTGYSALYASSIQTLNTAGAYYNDWVIEQRFNSSATGTWSTSSGRNLVSAFGSGSSATRKAGVSADSGEVTQAIGSLAAGTKYLLVTKYTVSGASITSATLYAFNETAYGNYRTNSTPATAEANLPAYALFSLTDTGTASLSGFDFLQFSLGGGPSGQVDEFRLGTAITDVVNIAVPPVISGLTNQTVTASNNVVLSPTVTGTAPLSCQWRENDVNLPGETNVTLTLANVQTNQNGYVYALIATNAYGAATNSMTLTVLSATSTAPTFTLQPTSQTASVGASVLFTAAATGVPAPTFQWLKNGTNLPGATNPTLTLTNVQVADSGVFSVIASNSVGSVASSNATLIVDGPNGFCMVDGTTTGGAGGTVVTVTNASDFATQIGTAGPRVIQVSGVLTVGDTWSASDKTILGLGTNATLLGRISISGVTNVIIRNLRFTDPGNDGISIRDPNTHHVWVDHCTFYDCGDGSCDISQEADYVTVSWCKFIYPTQLEHRFVMIGSGISNAPTHITLHHNWWGHRADQRMAASGDAFVHTYNNYYTCTNDSYCQSSGDRAEINSENNYYSGVDDPLGVSPGTDGKIRDAGNIYIACTGNQGGYGDTVFTPPYGYLLDATTNVPAMVQAGAGAPGPETMSVPPKVWDGGGANNNLNTANNWAPNEAPRKFDALLFAGGTRLAPNNDFAANTEFRSLLFSNNASAFVLGGNTINLGAGVTNDSPNTQTLNLNLNFSFGLDHYSTERRFEISHPNGSLVLNGSIVGITNGYTRPYAVYKTGPGLLTLNGAGLATLGNPTNDFYGAFTFGGGLVRFNNATNLGTADLTFDGGGLQWASGNTADISGTSVAISAGGAALDVGPNNVVFASPVGVGGAGGLTKMGAGKLTLNGNNSFSGNTLIAAGTLALGTAGALPSSSQLILTNNSILDVSGRSDGSLALGNGKKLLGTGTVWGSVTAASGATIAPGFSIGTLTISNVLTLQPGSTNLMQLDAASHTNDLITGLARVNYGGRLIVTNLGGSFAPGDTFKLFSAGIYNGSFSSLTLPSLGGNLYWTNKLAVDGTLEVVAPVNTTPTSLVFSINTGVMNVSWPADHTGWRLEGQTNAPGIGLTTNWSNVPGSADTNQVFIPIISTNGSVFYRLVYP